MSSGPAEFGSTKGRHVASNPKASEYCGHLPPRDSAQSGDGAGTGRGKFVPRSMRMANAAAASARKPGP